MDYLFVRKDNFSLEDAYYMPGHNAYRYTGGVNFIGMACVVLPCVLAMCFVYNPFNGIIHSDIFYLTTGSGFTALCGALFYFLMQKTRRIIGYDI